MEFHDWARFAAGLVLLAYGAWRDWKSREVEHIVWIGMIASGLVIIEWQFALEAPALYLIAPLPLLIIFLTVFAEGEVFEEELGPERNIAAVAAMNAVAVVVLAYLYLAGGWNRWFASILGIVAINLLAYLFYRTRVLYGGADALAFLALSFLLPFYPSLSTAGLRLPVVHTPPPLDLALPFALVVLFNSALLLLFFPLVMALYNLSRGDRGTPMFFGYRIPLKEVMKKKVFLVQRVDPDAGDAEGEEATVVLMFPPRGEEDGEVKEEIRLLRQKGIGRVWVTPQLPFIVAMLAGFAVSFMAGNMLIGLFVWILG